METNIAPRFVFDIYNAIFGYRALPFPQGAVNHVVQAAEKLSAQGAVLYRKEANGAEAFCPIDIYHPGTKKNYSLPYSTVSVTLQKNIQETALPGRRGSVKELIQIEDTKYTIQGIIIGDDLPEEEIAALNELFEINEPVKLKSAFAEIFMQADNTVVIKSMDFPDMKGITGAQAYSIELTTDAILELEEN